MPGGPKGRARAKKKKIQPKTKRAQERAREAREKEEEAQKKVESTNRFRKNELQNTHRWLNLPPDQGLLRMLPLPPSGEAHDRLENIFPGPIDAGFPPNTERTILDYGNLKGIFKLNKQSLLRAHEAEEAKSGEEEEPSARRTLTDSFLRELGEQDLSKASGEDHDSYVKAGLGHARRAGLKRSPSLESLDEASSSESEDEPAGDVFDADDTLEEANAKRHTLTMTIGLLAKLTNRKILNDQDQLLKAKNNRIAAFFARESLRRHIRVLARLQKKADFLHEKLGAKFRGIRERWAKLEKRRQMLEKHNAEGESEVWDGYHQELEQFGRETKVEDLLEQGAMPLPGVGEKTLKRKLKEERAEKEAEKKRKAKRAREKKAKEKRAAATKGRTTQNQTPPPSKRRRTSGTRSDPAKKQGESTASREADVPEGKREKASSTSRSATGKEWFTAPADHPVHEWARKLGGAANYGSGRLNNCLIYAIANVMGVAIPDHLAEQIRDALVGANLMGVGLRDFLPAYDRVVDIIMQHLMSQQLTSGQAVQQVTVHIDTIKRGVKTVTVGNGPPVHIFHDGAHFWALRK